MHPLSKVILYSITNCQWTITNGKKGNFTYRSFSVGRVRATIERDKDGLDAQVYTWADYYPWGWRLPGRQGNPGGGDYRFAFQGQEKDDETGWEAFELRMYDPRLGRWHTKDVYGQYHSPYMAMGNNPICRVDPDGGQDGEKSAVVRAAGRIARTVVGNKGSDFVYLIGNESYTAEPVSTKTKPNPYGLYDAIVKPFDIKNRYDFPSFYQVTDRPGDWDMGRDRDPLDNIHYIDKDELTPSWINEIVKIIQSWGSDKNKPILKNNDPKWPEDAPTIRFLHDQGLGSPPDTSHQRSFFLYKGKGSNDTIPYEKTFELEKIY